MSLISELKRRNIFRVGLLYAASSWALLEVGTLLVAQLGLPGWIYRFVFALLVIGFPLALVFSWVFEITPEGLKREQKVLREQSITRQTGRKINKAIVVALIVAVVLSVVNNII